MLCEQNMKYKYNLILYIFFFGSPTQKEFVELEKTFQVTMPQCIRALWVLRGWIILRVFFRIT